MNNYNIPTAFTPEAILSYQPQFSGDTIAIAFQSGQDMYYCLAKEGRAETTDQELVAYLMKEIENEFSGLYSDIIPPSPVYLFGFCAGYTQEYLKTRLEK